MLPIHEEFTNTVLVTITSTVATLTGQTGNIYLVMDPLFLVIFGELY